MTRHNCRSALDFYAPKVRTKRRPTAAGRAISARPGRVSCPGPGPLPLLEFSRSLESP
jgi:hypothetical protein